MRHAASRSAIGLAVVTCALAACSSSAATSMTSSAATSAVVATTGPASTTTDPPDAVRRIDVGGYELPIECHGSGAPTVVYLAGTGGPAWSLPAPALFRDVLPATQRVCAYERVGLGQADLRPGSLPSTTGQAADELAALLDGAGERGPFVLVAHSFGGYVATSFAERYPAEVGGLVMLDVAYTPELVPRTSTFADGRASVDMAGSKQELIRARPYGTTPLIVVSDGSLGREDWVVAWADFNHAALAGQSGDALWVKAPESDHEVYDDVPDLVLDAIAEVSAAVRTGEPLRPCDDRFAPLAAVCLAADRPAPEVPEELVGWWTTERIRAEDVAALLDEHGDGEVAETVTASVGLPGKMVVGLGRGWFVAGTIDAPVVDHGTYTVEGDTLVLTSDGVNGTTVLRWSIDDGQLSLELLSDTLPDHDGAPDEAFALAIYEHAAYTHAV